MCGHEPRRLKDLSASDGCGRPDVRTKNKVNEETKAPEELSHLAKFSSLCSFTLMSNRQRVCRPSFQLSKMRSDQLPGFQVSVKKGMDTVWP